MRIIEERRIKGRTSDTAAAAYHDFTVIDTALLQNRHTAATNKKSKHHSKDIFAAVSIYIYFILLVGHTF